MLNISFLPLKKAAAVGAISLLVFYVLAILEEYNPVFHFTRNAAHKNATSPTQHYINSSSTPTTTTSALAAQSQQIGQTFARAFYSNKYFLNSSGRVQTSPPWWCTREPNDNHSCKNQTQMLCQPKGLLFVKTPKTGSTTISHIVKRIVQNVAKRSNVDFCQHREDHVTGAGLWYNNRDQQQSFLMASIRDPAQRAMSRFFWSYVTRRSDAYSNNINGSNNSIVDDAFIQDYLNRTTSVSSGCTSKGQGGYQLNYITMSSIPEWSAWDPQIPTQVVGANQVERNVEQVMRDYDMIMLNERMDESLVLLQLLLGLQAWDIVSLSYNVGGSYRYEKGKCKQLIKSHISPGMQEYFQSDEWYAKNYGDYLLYEAVDKSMDLTIDLLGRETFNAAMKEFKRLETKINTICTQKVPFPCSDKGTVLFHTRHAVPHDKIARCIDAIVQQEALDTTTSYEPQQ